jgi:hypothetical protein
VLRAELGCWSWGGVLRCGELGRVGLGRAELGHAGLCTCEGRGGGAHCHAPPTPNQWAGWWRGEAWGWRAAGGIVSGGVGHEMTRSPMCTAVRVVLRVLVPVPITGSCGVGDCSAQGWGTRGLCGAHGGDWQWGLRGSTHEASGCHTAW